MAYTEIVLSGSPLGSIETRLLSSELDASDMFYLSQQKLFGVDPDREYDSGTTIYTNSMRSTKFTYEALSSAMLSSFKKLVGLGSMAWESSSDYSFVNHIHDYSKVEITSRYKSTDNDGKMLSVASFQIDGATKKVLWAKIPSNYKLPPPSIGQLKFLALDKLKDIDESDLDFDGWTWPDGRTVKNTLAPCGYRRFGRAAKYFTGDSKSQTFKLPNLRNFINALGRPDESLDSSVSADQIIPVPEHSHPMSVKMSESSKINFEFKFKLGSSASSTGTTPTGCHTAKKSSDIWFSHDIWFRAYNMQITNATVSEENPEMEGETFPTHNLLPVMIYIGKPVVDSLQID